MAKCLFPVSVKVDMGVSTPVSALKFRNIRPYKYDTIEVPCGKCINCLKNRQNALASRFYAEAEKSGRLSFVTLTYNDEHLPLASSTYFVDKRTGEYIRKPLELLQEDGFFKMVNKPEIIENVSLDLRKEILRIKASNKPRYLDVPIFEDNDVIYLSRVTPSCNRKDVRLWLKASRVAFERKYGTKLVFKYACVEEMGPRTCRPHYHILFFGLNKDEVRFLVDRWSYGFTYVEYVNRVNEDNSDGFYKVSRYISKYMTKGVFECPSVKDKCAEKPRLFQSKGIGSSLVDKLRGYMCAFDMYGKYDLDTLYSPVLGRVLSESELSQLVAEIPKRLVYHVNDKITLPVPCCVREKVFKRENPTDKTKKISTTIFALVSDFVRSQLVGLRRQEFEEFLAGYPPGEYDKACVEFEVRKKTYSQIENEVGMSNLQAYYGRNSYF